MARFNQLAGRSPQQSARRADNQAARRESLEARGADIGAMIRELKIGERRACTEAERRLGLRWVDGYSFGQAQGHYLGGHD